MLKCDFATAVTRSTVLAGTREQSRFSASFPVSSRSASYLESAWMHMSSDRDNSGPGPTTLSSGGARVYLCSGLDTVHNEDRCWLRHGNSARRRPRSLPILPRCGAHCRDVAGHEGNESPTTVTLQAARSTSGQRQATRSQSVCITSGPQDRLHHLTSNRAPLVPVPLPLCSFPDTSPQGSIFSCGEGM